MTEATETITSRADYRLLLAGLQAFSERERIERLRLLCQTDLFFLLRYVLNVWHADRDFVFERCREVQAAPDGYLDLWAREHYKSTIITFALTIQDILNDPEITVGIFSHTGDIANAFLAQIRTELTKNQQLLSWFPDILWQPKERPPGVPWSIDNGIVVKRKGNPKEATVEASGLVDGMPTSRHYKLMVYDDVVTEKSVTTPEQIEKTTKAWELSRALGSDGGRTRYIGTRYHFNDAYGTMISRGSAVERRHVATVDGTPGGAPVLLSPERLNEMRTDMGPYTFACQMMQDPRADGAMGFQDDWLRFYDRDPVEAAAGANLYILVDAASAKKAAADYTCMWVWALAPDGNMYWVDGLRDRLNLKQRGDALFALQRKWQPIDTGYERYGMMADVEYIQERMERENYRFGITEVAGQTAKDDRIRRLIPDFAMGRIWLPRRLLKMNVEGQMVDLTRTFLDDEYRAFPVAAHDDMLDAASRIKDMSPVFPRPVDARPLASATPSDDDYNPFQEG